MTKQTVRVGCRQPNGLMIRATITEPKDPFSQPRLSGAIRLNGPPSSVAAGAFSPTEGSGAAFGTTDVDPEFWRLWVDQNKGRNPILDGGTVFLLDDEGKPAENPT